MYDYFNVGIVELVLCSCSRSHQQLRSYRDGTSLSLT